MQDKVRFLERERGTSSERNSVLLRFYLGETISRTIRGKNAPRGNNHPNVAAEERAKLGQAFLGDRIDLANLARAVGDRKKARRDRRGT